MFDSMGQPKLIDAVNYMLRSYGSSEVSRLKETKDAVLAESVLNAELVKTLATGYNFCTSRDVLLTRDVDDYIYLPADCLKIEPTPPYKYVLPVKRGNRAYSLALNTFEFPIDIKVNLLRYIAYEDLPTEVAAFVAVRSAVSMIAAKKPDDPILRYLSNDLQLAKVELENFDHTVSEDNPAIYYNWRD